MSKFPFRLLAAAPAAAGLAAVLLLAGPAQAQSCTTIGSSTFCGARGSHNTVGNTVIFNQGPAGQRIGNYNVIGTPPRTQVIRGAERSPLAAPRAFSGISANKRFSGSGPYYDSRISALRAEALAIEAQHRLEQLNLTPAQEAAKTQMSPALVRALTLAQQAREKAAAGGATE
ncbi:MAG TPA: hypothetical protein VKP12_10030 [Kiloniellaceae bacterium]|nr:hypothetical protein [Kiloniellaceae bacterium]